VTQKQGKRHSTADAYLKPALNRPNLTVRTDAHVTDLLFEKTRAVGIAYRHDGRPDQVRVSREVILCGGTINSPQLLLLSGIGPADQLRALNIPVVVDLPGVGENLQDHLTMAVVYQCTQPVTLASAETMGNILNFLLFKKGPLTSNCAEAAAFIKTKPGLPAPDLDIIFHPVYFLDHTLGNPAGHGFTFSAIGNGGGLMSQDIRGRRFSLSDGWPGDAVQAASLQDSSSQDFKAKATRIALRGFDQSVQRLCVSVVHAMVEIGKDGFVPVSNSREQRLKNLFQFCGDARLPLLIAALGFRSC
jgi:choline dehydrogenase-like flavoprotein